MPMAGAMLAAAALFTVLVALWGGLVRPRGGDRTSSD